METPPTSITDQKRAKQKGEREGVDQAGEEMLTPPRGASLVRVYEEKHNASDVELHTAIPPSRFSLIHHGGKNAS